MELPLDRFCLVSVVLGGYFNISWCVYRARKQTYNGPSVVSGLVINLTLVHCY